MKDILFFGYLLIIITAISGCNSSSINKDENNTKGWYKSKVWLNGLELTPHESINQQEFSRQYHANKVWWDEAFEFLKTQDLLNLKSDVYIIDSGNVFATIAEVEPKNKNQINFEAHRKFNDLQYIIKGKAEMGISSIFNPDAHMKTSYSTEEDLETFTVLKGDNYYVAEPGTFFIFSPEEMHRPTIKITGNGLVKRIVIKVRVP